MKSINLAAGAPAFCPRRVPAAGETRRRWRPAAKTGGRATRPGRKVSAGREPPSRRAAAEPPRRPRSGRRGLAAPYRARLRLIGPRAGAASAGCVRGALCTCPHVRRHLSGRAQLSGAGRARRTRGLGVARARAPPGRPARDLDRGATSSAAPRLTNWPLDGRRFPQRPEQWPCRLSSCVPAPVLHNWPRAEIHISHTQPAGKLRFRPLERAPGQFVGRKARNARANYAKAAPDRRRKIRPAPFT